MFLSNNPEQFWLSIIFFVFGALIGSFLNVVIHRLPLGESIVFPNSHCPHCQARISPFDNIPILSWLILRGRCRRCQTSISARYFWVELLTATAFAFVFWRTGFSYLLFSNLIFTALFIALIFIDAKHKILPNAINFPGLVLALVIRVVLPVLFLTAPFDDLQIYPFNVLQFPLWLNSLLGAFLGALVGGGSLWFVGWIWKVTRGIDAMGLGDVKMMFMVGAYLGWRLTILTIFLGALSGAIIGIYLISKQSNRDYQTQIPFGVFLGIGAFISMLYGSQIIAWYLQNFISY
jgi:leader peptidase (prepilin peptidase)/N-methyltransferase